MTVWLLGGAFVAGAILIGLIPAWLLRKRFGGVQGPDTRAVASDVMARIGVMHGLILSLVFASAHTATQKLQDDAIAEASTVLHIYANAQIYGLADLQAASVSYLRAAIDRDTPLLQERSELSQVGWDAWRRMLEISLALRPADRSQQLLADKIQADIWQVQMLREMRGYEAGNRLSGEFWLVAVVGLVLIATLLFVHQVRPLHHAIMAMYSGFTGLTLYMIYDMSHPFRGAISIDDSAFRIALQTIQSGL
jgi:hypothetical protein